MSKTGFLDEDISDVAHSANTSTPARSNSAKSTPPLSTKSDIFSRNDSRIPHTETARGDSSASRVYRHSFRLEVFFREAGIDDSIRDNRGRNLENGDYRGRDLTTLRGRGNNSETCGGTTGSSITRSSKGSSITTTSRKRSGGEVKALKTNAEDYSVSKQRYQNRLFEISKENRAPESSIASAPSHLGEDDIDDEEAEQPPRKRQSFDPETPTRRAESTQQSSEVRAAKETAIHLVKESMGKLNQDLMDLKLSLPEDLSAAGVEREYLDLREELCKTMSDDKTSVGELIEKIKKWGDGSEMDLQNSFVTLANFVALTLASSPSCLEHRISQAGTGIFGSIGNHVIKTDDSNIKCKFDVIIHGPMTSGDRDLSFATAYSFVEVKKRPSKDLKDELLGQCLRYAHSMVHNHPCAGRGIFLTLCGPILRLWYTDATSFGSSTAYSLEDQNDYPKIIDIIAFLSGPPELILEQWQPQANSVLDITRFESGVPQKVKIRCRVTRIENLFVASNLWGRRTAVWKADVETLEGQQLLGTDGEGMWTVIKSTWLPEELSHHELDLLEWLKNFDLQDEEIQNLVLPLPMLPIPVGLVDQVGHGRINGVWSTADKTAHNSTMVTRCPPGALVFPEDLCEDDHFRLFTSVLRTLLFLGLRGVHYRDFNEGNLLLYNVTGTIAAILIDFGHARVLLQRRGRTYLAGSDDLKTLTYADARSANDYFMSIRIHELSQLTDEIAKLTEECNELRHNLRDETIPSATIKIAAELSYVEKELKQGKDKLANTQYIHTYIDDVESAIYLFLYQGYRREKIGRASNLPQLKIASICNLTTKREIWDKPGRTAAACMPNYHIAICKIIEKVQSCQESLSQLDSGEPDMGGKISNIEVKCLKECIALCDKKNSDINAGIYDT